jgi:chemotaxis signal transduction protein
MRILAFTIGQHHFGLPADRVSTVGKRAGSQESKSVKTVKAEEFDLAADMFIGKINSDLVISCSVKGRTVNLYVENIVGLVDLKDDEVFEWPGVLKRIPIFFGVGLSGSVMYLLMDLTKIGSLKGNG